jgi:probable HAF family extracellular repeat protein
MSRGWLIRFTLLSLALLGLAAGPARAQSLALQNLGTLGGTGSLAFGLNDRGQVVGASTTAAGAPHAFLWEKGQMTDLGTLGGTDSVAFGINDHGQVVGASYTTGDAARHAFLWEQGQMTDLGTLGGNISIAYAINNRGQVVGEANTTENAANHAFLWEKARMTDLGTLGGNISTAFAINDRGQVVGSAYTTRGALHAFLWQQGPMTDLGTLGGFNSIAYGINNRGQIVGMATTAGDTAYRAFLWKNGQMTDLGTLGGPSSAALGINNRGQVVGYAANTFQRFHTFSWDSTDGMKDLNSEIAPGSGWELGEVLGLAVSDAGEITGDGRYQLQTLGYLLTPPAGKKLTPEATSSATAAMEQLRDAVKQGDGSTPVETFLYLSFPLEAAVNRLAEGNTAAAVNLLQAFIQQVDALIRDESLGGSLAPATGQRWIDAAQALQALLRP